MFLLSILPHFQPFLSLFLRLSFASVSFIYLFISKEEERVAAQFSFIFTKTNTQKEQELDLKNKRRFSYFEQTSCRDNGSSVVIKGSVFRNVEVSKKQPASLIPSNVATLGIGKGHLFGGLGENYHLPRLKAV